MRHDVNPNALFLRSSLDSRNTWVVDCNQWLLPNCDVSMFLYFSSPFIQGMDSRRWKEIHIGAQRRNPLWEDAIELGVWRNRWPVVTDHFAPQRLKPSMCMRAPAFALLSWRWRTISSYHLYTSWSILITSVSEAAYDSPMYIHRSFDISGCLRRLAHFSHISQPQCRSVFTLQQRLTFVCSRFLSRQWLPNDRLRAILAKGAPFSWILCHPATSSKPQQRINTSFHHSSPLASLIWYQHQESHL